MTAEEIAAGLSEAETNFLSRVCDGMRLGIADREQDKVRQRVRRLGLVHIVKNPRRWVALPLGIAVRQALMEGRDG